MPTGPLTIYNDVTITGNLSVTESLLVHNDTLFVDNDTNNVGIGTLDPSAKLNVAGDILASGYIKASGDLYGNNIVYNTGDQTISGIKTFNQLKTLSGSPIALKAIDLNYSEPREFTVINKKYADENFNLCIEKDLSFNTSLYLDFPTGTGIDSSSSNFPKNTKKVSLALMQPSGFGWGVNYNNVDWLTSSPPNPTFGNPTFSEFYPQGPHTTRSYGIHLNAIANLEKNKSDIVYRTGNQTISGYKRFEEDVYIKNLYVTGTETIVSSTNTNVSSNYLLLNITGGATDGGIFFVTGSGLTGINDSGAIIGFDDFENFKFGIGTRLQDLNSLNTMASTSYVNNSVSGLSGFIFDVASTDFSIPSTLVLRSSLGYSDFSQIGINETNYPNPNKTIYQYNNITYGFGGSENPDSYKYNFPSQSGEFALDTTAVMLTGNQTVNGVKNFTSIPTVNNTGVYLNSNPSGYLNSLLTSKTIYVDATTGSDTRNGFSKYDLFKPYRTIAAAAAASVTNDLIYVRAGTYTITSQINLNGKGNLYFEPGVTVRVFSAVVAFSYSQTADPFVNAIGIRGDADFILLGSTAGVLTMGGNTKTTVAFECNSITGPDSVSGPLFSCSAGVLSVDAKTIAMTSIFTNSNATVFNITGTGKVTARVPFVYCGVFVNGTGDENLGLSAPAQINADIWTLITYNITAGMTLNRVVTQFRIVNYNHVGVGVALSWTEDTTVESHVFRGITWSSVGVVSQQPHITFASTAGTTNSKIIRLLQSNTMRYASTNSLSSTVPINVGTHSTFASVPATSNIAFKVGSFTVDTDVNTY